MKLKPIKTKKISEEIVDQIKNLFLTGSLKPGDRLPSERELSETLGVSRSAVREALSALDLMGLIEIKPGSGTYVRQVRSNEIYTSLSMMLLVEPNTFKEIFELRKIMEVASAQLAAKRRTEEDLGRMQQALDHMEKDWVEGRLGEKADFQFHYAVSEAAGNRLLVRLMNTISDHMRQTVKAARAKMYSTPGTPQRLLSEHREVFEAIRAGDEAKAGEAMMKHLSGTENEMLKEIKNLEKQADPE